MTYLVIEYIFDYVEGCVMQTLRPQLVQATSGPLMRVAPTAVACGFPSPAQDYYDDPIDLTGMLVANPATTFIVRAAGNSMMGAGIAEGDELLVDRSLQARHGEIVIAILDGELTVKRLQITPNGVSLQAENHEYPDILVPEMGELRIWGVVTYCIHHLR